MIKGVNLGNWLVLEKWMSPALFDGTTAEDEFYLCTDLSEQQKRERLKVHRDSYITERDFAYIAARGLDAVRIPVPHFVFADTGPYVSCIDYLDRAFGWAQTYGLKVLPELHTVPESQNGFDNGGICGVCKWHTDPAYVATALDVLERLTERYRESPAFWGIGVLNEPVSREVWEGFDIPGRYLARDPERARGSEPVPTDFLMDFYAEAYGRIRAQSADVTVVFHDGFRIREWGDYFRRRGFERFAVDIHLYLMMHLFKTGQDDLDSYLTCIETDFAPTVREMSKQFPLIIGEWCIDSTSTKPLELSREERTRYFQQLADAQLAAWEPAEGWFYWSYKLLADGAEKDGWDLGKSIELGYLPSTFAST